MRMHLTKQFPIQSPQGQVF